jgi:hypothetical protein
MLPSSFWEKPVICLRNPILFSALIDSSGGRSAVEMRDA